MRSRWLTRWHGDSHITQNNVIIQKIQQIDPKLQVQISNQGRGGEEHWRIIDKDFAVNWWPFSRNATAWCEPTGRKYTNVDSPKLLNILANRPTISTKNSEPLCPNCGKRMRLRGDSKFAKHGKWYACVDFPKCNGSIGSHPDGKPLGTPANQETKEWRIKAHEVFDLLWKDSAEKNKARRDAYMFMSQVMDIPLDGCHIGSFDKDMCQKIIQICNSLSNKEKKDIKNVNVNLLMARVYAESSFKSRLFFRMGLWARGKLRGFFEKFRKNRLQR